MRKYPNYITFAWERISDGDMEIVGTLNGETFDDEAVWIYLVEQTLKVMRMEGRDVQAYHREDVYSVLIREDGDEGDWQIIDVKGA